MTTESPPRDAGEATASPAGPLWVLVAALLVPALPLVLAGWWIEPVLGQWILQLRSAPGLLGAAVITVLGLDIFLPVPSSLVAALAGQTLGPSSAVLCVWLGMTLSALLGYGLARTWGPALVRRLVHADRLARIEALHRRYGARLLALTRPLPIVAEAYVLLVAAHRFPFLPFLLVVSLSNGVIATAFVALGIYSAAGGWTAAALVISVVVPLLLTGLFERCGVGRRAFRVR